MPATAQAGSTELTDPLLQPLSSDDATPPPVAPLPSSNAADRSSLPDSGSGPKVMPGAPGSKLAVVSYLAASALKGIGQGKQIADQIKWAKSKRTMDGLQYNYQIAAKNLAGLTEAQADPKEIAQARAARDASWQAMMGYYQQQIFSMDGGKKGKKSKSQAGAGAGANGGQPESQDQIMADLNSPDPKVKREAYFKLAARLGPPDEWRLKQYNSPQAVQQREMAAKQAQAQLDVENKRLRLHELEQRSDLDQPGHEAEKAELERLQEDRELFPAAAGLTPHAMTFDTKGSDIPEGTLDAMGQPIDKTKTYRRVDRAGVSSWVPSIQKSTGGKPTIGWARDAKGKWYSAEIDPATNQFKEGTENYDRVPPPGLLDKQHTSEFTMKDADGKVHRIETTSTTRPILPATSGTTGGAGAKKAGETGPLGVKASPGDRIVGNAGAGGQAMSRATAADSVLNLLPQATRLLKDPDVQRNLGVLNGRWSEVEKKIGDLDPKTQEFYGILKSIYAANGTMHGWRSLKAPEEFEKAYGDLHTDPATLTGGLKAVAESAKVFYQSGYHHPWSPKPTTEEKKPPPSTGTGAGDGTTPQTADDYLKHVVGQ